MELLENDPGKEIAILGCGVIGLSTAILLQKRGYQVTIYTKDLPPNTTSNIAGAFWSPVSVFENSKVDAVFMDQFNSASVMSQRMFQDYVSDHYGVWWAKSHILGSPFNYPGGRELYPDFKERKDLFGYSYAEEFYTLMIEPAIYLQALLEDFYVAGGKLVNQTLGSVEELGELVEMTIMNCTGLGSHQLFNDRELVPIKGQLTVLLPQEEVQYCYVVSDPNDLLYMFPRKDGIVLGGTYVKGDWSLEPDTAEMERVLKGHKKIADLV